ncbi:MAG: glycosyltransferase [Bacilli bacterium]
MINLFLLTDAFPFGKGEDFIMNEVEYLSKKFEKIFIIPSGIMCDTSIRRQLPENMIVLNPLNQENIYAEGNPSKSKRIIWGLRNMMIWVICCFFQKCFYRELFAEIKENGFSLKKIKYIIRILSPCLRNIHHYKKDIQQEMFSSDTTIIYSFWFDYSQYMMSRIISKNKIKGDFIKVSRGHRHDIYVEESKYSYLPFRDLFFSNLDRLYISTRDGFTYMQNKYPQHFDKIYLSYLGTKDHGYNGGKKRDVFRIVSCSLLSPVKRVDLIIEALTQLPDMNIEWVHFGDGLLYEQIKELAKNKLKGHISYKFMGYTANDKMLKYYEQNDIHLFINVSTSEGLPVSIQEAISFGYPIIATDVGSTREAVISEYNGCLIDKDFQISKLVSCIKYLREISDEEYKKICLNSRKLWEDNFNANKLYDKFIDEISIIC